MCTYMCVCVCVHNFMKVKVPKGAEPFNFYHQCVRISFTLNSCQHFVLSVFNGCRVVSHYCFDFIDDKFEIKEIKITFLPFIRALKRQEKMD